MRRKCTSLLAALLALFGGLPAAVAHHGASMFDMNRLITVKGIVTEFQFINPHGMIYFEARNDTDVVKWSAETRGGPNILTQAGWSKDTLKPGDQITFVGHPAKNHSRNMRLAKVVFPDGREMSPDVH